MSMGGRLLNDNLLGGGNSNIFYFHHYLGKISHLTSIFFRWVGSTTNQFFFFSVPFSLQPRGSSSKKARACQEKLRQAEGRANSAERAAQALTEGVFLGLGSYGGKKIRDIYIYMNNISCLKRYDVMIYILIFVHLLLFNLQW